MRAILVGCGLGSGAEGLEEYLEGQVPTVIDADGLNYLSRNGTLLDQIRNRPYIITPHPAEMARLCGTSVAEVEADRINTARNFAVHYGITVVLKGHHTLIA